MRSTKKILMIMLPMLVMSMLFWQCEEEENVPKVSDLENRELEFRDFPVCEPEFRDGWNCIDILPVDNEGNKVPQVVEVELENGCVVKVEIFGLEACRTPDGDVAIRIDQTGARFSYSHGEDSECGEIIDAYLEEEDYESLSEYLSMLDNQAFEIAADLIVEQNASIPRCDFDVFPGNIHVYAEFTYAACTQTCFYLEVGTPSNPGSRGTIRKPCGSSCCVTLYEYCYDENGNLTKELTAKEISKECEIFNSEPLFSFGCYDEGGLGAISIILDECTSECER